MTCARLVPLILLVACAAEPQVQPRHEKPSAPVEVELTQRRLDGNAYEVTLTATALRDVAALELTLDGRTQQVGAVRAGEVRTSTSRITIGAIGRTVAGGIAVGTGRHRRTRAATVTIGQVAQPKPLPTRIVTLPDGTAVEEVRP
jgi:hypothetical protein